MSIQDRLEDIAMAAFGVVIVAAIIGVMSAGVATLANVASLVTVGHGIFE